VVNDATKEKTKPPKGKPAKGQERNSMFKAGSTRGSKGTEAGARWGKRAEIGGFQP